MDVLGAACCQQKQIHRKPNIEQKSMLGTLSVYDQEGEVRNRLFDCLGIWFQSQPVMKR